MMKDSVSRSRSILTGVNLFVIILIICCLNYLSSCEKTGVDPQFSYLSIDIKHSVDGVDIQYDPYQFVNEAGNSYSITDLKYYLSNISLQEENGETHHDNGIYYIDIRNDNTLRILLDSIKPGKYAKITFDLGIDSSRNLTNYLPNTLDNINMAWPVPMGGGYHFLKLEGKFLDGSMPYGFAFHLGKSKMIIHYSLVLDKKLTYWNEKLTLKHNVSQWFKDPLTYDFLIHEPYSMNSDSVMQVITYNGADVFSL